MTVNLISSETANQLTSTWTCWRKTKRWPAVCFSSLVYIAAKKTLIIWLQINSLRVEIKRFKRNIHLEAFAREIVTWYTLLRDSQPRLIQTISHGKQFINCHKLWKEKEVGRLAFRCTRLSGELASATTEYAWIPPLWQGGINYQ